jgi:phenylalanine-4-hydroxylase
MQQVSESPAALTGDVSPAHACGAHASDNLPEFIEQHWSDYTAEQHDVWGLLYQRRMQQLATDGSRVFLDGAKVIGLRQDIVPDLADVNARLSKMTGWNAVPVSGFLPAREFFQCLSVRRFPTTIIVRTREQMDYLPEPDIFHDIFGHVPLHADKVFADFLQTYGKAALECSDDSDTERLSRLFWFTVEFGLIREDGRLKVYGSGLISSPGESRHSLTSPDVERRPFDLETVCNTSFEIDHYQPILYVLESFEQLRDAMNTYANRILNNNRLRAAV